MPEAISGLDLLFNEPKARPVATPVDAPKVSGLDLLFGGKDAALPRPKNEQLTYAPEKTLGFGQQAKGSFASDESEWIRFAAKELYPSEPLESSVKRFGKTQEGRIFHKGDDGNLYEVQPPSGFGRLANIGSGVGPALPMAAATVAGIATAPMAATGVGALGTVAATGGAGAAGEWLRQGLGDVILGDASTGELNKTAIATEGALSAAGQGLGVGLGKWATKYAAPDIARLSPQAADELYGKAEKIGVKLTPGEATGLESQIAEQKRLKGIPEAANLMGDFYKERNTNAATAFRSFLDTISPPRDAAVLGSEGKAMAEQVMGEVKKTRTQTVSPFYKQAERETGAIDATPVLQTIDDALQTAKGSARSVLQKARDLLMKPGTAGTKDEALDDTFRGLDNTKKAIDAMLRQSSLGQEAQGIDRYARSVLTEVKDTLTKTIDTAVKAGPGKASYEAGRKTYQTLTEQVVDPAKEALAPLLRVNPENSTVVQAASAMLDPGRRSPEQIKLAKSLVNPKTWNGLVRAYLQQEAHNALQTMAKGDLGNVAGNISKKIGDENVMANLKAALPQAQVKELEDMLDVFRAAAKSLDTNSDTAFKLAAEKLAKRRDMGTAAKVIEYLRPWDKAKALQDFFAERNYAKQAKVIADIITSGDRKAISRLRALKNYGPNDWRRWAVIGDVLVRGGALGTEEVLD